LRETGKSVNDTNRLKFHGNQSSSKGAEAMGGLFAGREDGSQAHASIAERCNFKLNGSRTRFRNFTVPEGIRGQYFERGA